MRFLPYLQVLLLLALTAYLLLITLENPGLLHFPLPFGRGEWLVSSGIGVILAVLVGGLYTTTLLLPALWHEKWLRRQDRRGQRHLENQLVATLQARVATLPVSTGASDTGEKSGTTAETQLQTETDLTVAQSHSRETM